MAPLIGNQLSRLAKRSAGFFLRRSLHTEWKVQVQGLNLNIVQCGDGPRSLLLLPGTLGTAWTDFKPQLEQLPTLLPQYTIIAWDPPGYGKSVPPQRQFGVDFFHSDAKAAVALMEALNRPKFSILGWSGGGITSLIIAGRYAENVEKMAIWGNGAYLTKEEVKEWIRNRDVNKLSPRMREPMEQFYGKERFAQLWGEWVDTICEFQKQRDGDMCCADVEKIRAPTFILRGKKDPIIAYEHVDYLRKKLPWAKYYEFPEGKHNIHLRYPEKFNKLVADFFNDKSG